MSRRRVLVVEDEGIVARDIVMQLQGLNIEALGPASTGEEAFELAARLRPDLVLMDIHLGSAMDGIAAAQILRAQWGIPSIFMSAFGSAELIARANLAEPVGYLEKPFEEFELREILNAVIDER